MSRRRRPVTSASVDVAPNVAEMTTSEEAATGGEAFGSDATVASDFAGSTPKSETI